MLVNYFVWDNVSIIIVAISFAFFIAPTPKFIEGFLQTINHWFWINSLKGPIHLSRAGSMGAVPGQVIRLWVSKFDRPAVGSRLEGGTSSSVVQAR